MKPGCKIKASDARRAFELHDRLQATVIYVTHDQVETMTMGTKIVVMKDGLIL